MRQTIGRGVRWLERAYHRMRADRQRGVAHEVSFWDDWLRTRGLEWPESYRERLDPERELSAYYRGFIDHLPQDEIAILDVGAGPLTALGPRHPSKRLRITATDALAAQYDALLARHGVTPPVRTIVADGERLVEQFGHASFDLVTAQNCVDHMEQPLEAIRQMLLVARPGCFVVLSHFPEEGTHAGFVGMHQWDFTIEDGEFVMRGRRGAIRPAHELAALGSFACSFDGRFIRVHIRRHPASAS